MNKSEYPSPKDDLGKVWLKLAQWFWRRRFLKLFHIFYIFAIISLGNDQWSSYEEI
jgi:hypothetical protein